MVLTPSAPTTHRVVTGVDGQPVLVKRATDPQAVARLTGEATVLRTLAHPGAVAVVDVRPDELHLAWDGPHTLATVTGLPVGTAGDLVAQVAATVADLHRAGIVHRRLTADHVLLAPGGRAVLTGFADAARAGDLPTGRADDVADLGALLTRLVAPHDGGPVIPESRRVRGGDGGRRAALLTLADRAQADDPETRPSAAELAASVRAAAGPPPKGRREPRRRPTRRPQRRTLAGLALGAIVAATVAAAAWITPSSAEPEVEAAPTTTVPDRTTTTVTTPSTTTTTTTVPATTAACPPVDGFAADVDGDGCPEPVSIQGERVTVGMTTWRAGRPGDLLVVADWDCDGRATVASLRASTGEVFVFDRWERALTVDATTQVDGAIALRAVDPDGDGCARLVADRPGREPVLVEVAA
jgi:hypothetical protein